MFLVTSMRTLNLGTLLLTKLYLITSGTEIAITTYSEMVCGISSVVLVHSLHNSRKAAYPRQCSSLTDAGYCTHKSSSCEEPA
jgi:hypothetical protein